MARLESKIRGAPPWGSMGDGKPAQYLYISICRGTIAHAQIFRTNHPVLINSHSMRSGGVYAAMFRCLQQTYGAVDSAATHLAGIVCWMIT